MEHAIPRTTTPLITASILLVEDDPLAQQMYAENLRAAGYEVVVVDSIEAMKAKAHSRSFDLLVVDLGLPDGNGLEAAEVISRSTTPVICITVNDSVDIRVEALERVAVDFLVKPFDERELVARARNALRPHSQAGRDWLGFHQFRYQARTGKLINPQGEAVPLSTTDHKLLYALVMTPGRPLSREWLSTEVLGRWSDADQRIIDVQVSRLRKKLGGTGARLIRTVRHVGYLFDAEVVPVDG